jgi:hypothetical protein
MSKHLKRVFEANLGFNIRIGKGRARVVLIPLGWVDVEEKRKDMLDFIEAGLTIDVQNVHDVHPEGDSDDEHKTSELTENTDLTATGDPKEDIVIENTPLIKEESPPSPQQSAPGDEPLIVQEEHRLIEAIREIEAETGKGATQKAIREKIPLWNPTHLSEVLKITERDKFVFQPTPGIWRVAM